MRLAYMAATVSTIVLIVSSLLGPLDSGIYLFFEYGAALLIPIAFAAGALALHCWKQDAHKA